MSKEEENNKKQEDTSSVIDEALVDAEKIQDFIKENTKDMLKSTVDEQVKKSFKGALNEEEEDEEEEYEEEEVEDEEGEESEEEGGEEEMELPIGDEEGGEEDYAGGEETDYSGEEDYTSGEEDYEGGETIDMTQASEEEVLDIYKKLKDEDEVEVVDDETKKITDSESGNEYLIKSNGEESESEVDLGQEFSLESEDYMTENEEPVYEIELDGEDEEKIDEDKPRKAGHDPQDQVKGATAPEEPTKTSTKTDEEHHGDNLEGGFPEDEATKDGAGHHAEYVMNEDDDDIDLGSITAEDLSEESGGESESENSSRKKEKAKGTRDLGKELPEKVDEAGEQGYDYEKDTDYRDEEGEVPGEQATGPDERTDENEEEVEEGSVRAYPNGRNQSTKPQNFPKERMGGRDDHFKKARGIGESKEDVTDIKKRYNNLLNEAKQLKKENKKFKSSLKKFKNMLAETAVFNSNLTYATRLFMGHSVTGEEKEKIIEKFDKEANTLKESKKVYESLDNELKNKTPLNEEVQNKIETQASSGTSGQLNETNAYADNGKFGRMKELMGHPSYQKKNN